MEQLKSIIITIDTEGDNQWGWKDGNQITTENVLFLNRFQELCNSFEFKPVWLTNWEMLHDNRYVDFVMKKQQSGSCEIGMHLHAWNNPPYYQLKKRLGKAGAPYLIEFPHEIIEEKISSITEEFNKVLGFCPISHRAGRWAINDVYYRLLYKYGYKVDCSVTPGVDWKRSWGYSIASKGSDYRNEKSDSVWKWGILEVPMTTIETNEYYEETFNRLKGVDKYKYYIRNLFRHKRIIMFRPDGANLMEMKKIIERVGNNDLDYIMFMIHSSELMPGGSPTFKDRDSIENLYRELKYIFPLIKKNFIGCTLAEYYDRKTRKHYQ